MRKVKEKSLHCCYCCVEVLSGFLLLMLVASTITLLRYFLEFYEPMPAYSGNKTELLINVTTTPKTSGQSFVSAEKVPQSSVTSFIVSQELTARLTSSSSQSSVPSVTSTVPQPAPPTNHLQEQTSGTKRDFPQVPTQKTSSLISPPPLVSATRSVLLRWLTSSAKQRSPEQLLTLPVKQNYPQQLSGATEMSSQQLASTVKPMLTQKPILPIGAMGMSSQQLASTVKTMLTQKPILPLNTTLSGKPFSGQAEEEDTSQYFKGSFSLVNETYHPNYSDHTSNEFRTEALKLENMLLHDFRCPVSDMQIKQFANKKTVNPFMTEYAETCIYPKSDGTVDVQLPPWPVYRV